MDEVNKELHDELAKKIDKFVGGNDPAMKIKELFREELAKKDKEIREELAKMDKELAEVKEKLATASRYKKFIRERAKMQQLSSLSCGTHMHMRNSNFHV